MLLLYVPAQLAGVRERKSATVAHELLDARLLVTTFLVSPQRMRRFCCERTVLTQQWSNVGMRLCLVFKQVCLQAKPFIAHRTAVFLVNKQFMQL